MNRYFVLIVFGWIPLIILLWWCVLTYDCWTWGDYWMPYAPVLEDGETLVNGRRFSGFFGWMVRWDMQEATVAVLGALSFNGFVGYIDRCPRKTIEGSRIAPDSEWDLSQRIMQLSPRDDWSIGDACMGTFVTGSTGSGKTTGPGAELAMSFLRAGFGGLVLCIKPDERRNWERYCQQAGREDDLIVFDASGRHRYSFLDEELRHKGAGAGLTENIVNLFSIILEIADRNGGNGRDSEQYWKRALRQLARNLVDLLVLAHGRVSVPELYRLAASAPTSFEQIHSDNWRRQSFCFECLRTADARAKSDTELQDFKLVADYFTSEFPGLSDKTRSVIVSTFTSLVDVLNRGLLRTLFSTDTTVRPEDTFNGKILVIDLPVKEFLEVGQFAAVLMKFCFQRAVERRDVNENPRPVFLWVDECQEVMTSFDMPFQSTARSSRVATVYLTQNISTMRAAFGNDQAEALTDALTGNLQTKFFCANGDPVTNEWAATIIGRTRQFFVNASQSQTDDWTNMLFGQSETQRSSGVSEQMEFELPPRCFTTLRTGGPKNRWQVDTVMFQGGRQFAASGKTWLPVTFNQQH